MRFKTYPTRPILPHLYSVFDYKLLAIYRLFDTTIDEAPHVRVRKTIERSIDNVDCIIEPYPRM